MTGLLALLDDIAALAKLAATQVDDIAAQATKAGSKAVGVVIDDAAVTPKYVQGLPAARELPIVWQIARASLFNKIVILLPAALLLSAFAPWLLPPLLMLGGAYLCFEGAEKIAHVVLPHHEDKKAVKPTTMDAAHLERERVAGAIKTDFILSAEIMAITLSAIETRGIIIDAIVLGAVGVVITAIVYGAVALIVKADDVGLRMSQTGQLGVTRAIGRGIVKGMPTVLVVIATIGTAAMLWVGGSIIVHSLKEMGSPEIYEAIKAVAVSAKGAVPTASGFVNWFTTAFLDGVLGLFIGLLLIPVVTFVLMPLFKQVKGAFG